MSMGKGSSDVLRTQQKRVNLSSEQIIERFTGLTGGCLPALARSDELESANQVEAIVAGAD
jgi:hypothetical protein